MKVSATSPGPKFHIGERVLVLKLTADDVGEAIDLAALMGFIDARGIELLAAYVRTLGTEETP